jgi:uncharacterized protein YmfQ (DUF2313 family)
MYGTEKYGTAGYSQEQEISPEDVNPYKPNLLKYITPLLRDVPEFKAWNEGCGYEIGLLKYCGDELLKQLFVDTATWGLIYWGNQYGIPINLNKSYEDRREVIKAKLRGSGTTTVQMIKNTAEAFSGGECNVIIHPENYSFTVQFIGIKGIPKNMEAFKQMLEDIKPAHLAYDFKYTYTVWDFLKEGSLTWDNTKSKTWDNLKVYDG